MLAAHLFSITHPFKDQAPPLQTCQKSSTTSPMRTHSTMYLTMYLQAVLLLAVALASAAERLSSPELEEAMKALISKVRKDQMWPSRPHQLGRQQHQAPKDGFIQSLILPHVTPSSSSIVIPSILECVNSILAAVVPEQELMEAGRNPEMFAQTPLPERPWYQGLPADVKECLVTVVQADQRLKESWQFGSRRVRAGKVARNDERRDSDELLVSGGQRQDVI